MPAADLACPQTPQRELFLHLDQVASTSPAVALRCAGILARDEQRDRVLRTAYLAGVESDPETVASVFASIADRMWIGEAGFFAAVKLANKMPESRGRLLLTAVVRHNPSVAVREVDLLRDLPYGMDIWRDAARGAPDEVALVAAGSSKTALAVRQALNLPGGDEQIRLLAAISGRENIDPLRRQRAAVCVRWIVRGRLTLERAFVAAGNTGAYFSLLAGFRVDAVAADARLLDRALENLAQVMFRWGDNAVNLSQLSARELVLLLAYGRSEEDEEQFGAIFDRFLAPKLRGGAVPWDLHLRRFLATAIVRGRLDMFVQLAGETPLAAAMRGVDTAAKPLEDAIAAAEIVDALQSPTRVKVARDALAAEYERAKGPRTRGLYGLLLARLHGKLDADDPLRRVAEPYLAHFNEPRSLQIRPLFGDGKICYQRYFFYNDDDGVESFEEFRAAYSADANWSWQTHGDWIHVVGNGTGERRIEIFANIPVASFSAEDDARIHRMTKLLADRRISPSVVVHRGHAYHVERTIAALNPSARLVYLGSCRGTDRIDAVMATARSAQVVATRSIGTKEINDPVLKTLNDTILRTQDRIEWSPFWSSLAAKVGHYRLFADYIPPNRNSAAILLAAYYDYLTRD